MKITSTESFKKDYRHLPLYIKEIFERKIRLFMDNIQHPSLRIKKMQGHENRRECSITMFYRFTFEIRSDCYILRRIGPHDDVLKNP
jgi:mRNA-degrading endonuclease YafQ of YafQ-DinJ toxin-antitoxin module